AQRKGWRAENDTAKERDSRRNDHGHPEVIKGERDSDSKGWVRRTKQCHRVRADCKKCGVSEIEQARVPDDHVEAERQHRVHQDCNETARIAAQTVIAGSLEEA